MIVVGIDPGLGGAICRIGGPGVVVVVDMPTVQIDRNGKAKRDIDVRALVDILVDVKPDHIFIEAVGAMPGQGVSSMFAFGKGFGILLGVVGALGLPMTQVAPVRWKRAMQVPKGDDAGRARASDLMPGAAHLWRLKKHHGRADAALIAEYGRRVLGATT